MIFSISYVFSYFRYSRCDSQVDRRETLRPIGSHVTRSRNKIAEEYGRSGLAEISLRTVRRDQHRNEEGNGYDPARNHRIHDNEYTECGRNSGNYFANHENRENYECNAIVTSSLQMHFKDDEANALTVYDDLSDTENEDEEEDIECTDNEEDNDEEIDGYSVENAYMEEKEESVMALKEIAEYTE